MQLEEFDDFFNKEVSLIPVPRSHRQIKDAMWPSKVICDVISKAGFAREVLPLLERIENVTTSSMSSPDSRPSVRQHMESLQLDSNTFFPLKVTLVDDLITQGRTLVACAQKILEKYPETQVRCFAILKTRNMIPDIPELVAPTFNYIDYYQSGKTFRHPAEQ